ncbi:MAG: hypothetical protein EPN89_05305 [Methylovulum sp.]|nr:MAG: hypothetical protein EPN89_05305 [Methylovulum sp.]
MLITAQGIYHDGIVELSDKPDSIVSGRVVVTFLDNDKTEGVASVSVNALERIAALRAWLPTLPEVPLIPLEALDRGLLYK